MADRTIFPKVVALDCGARAGLPSSRRVGAEDGAQSIAFESFGVRVRLATDAADAADRLWPLLPPDAELCDPATTSESFEILSEGGALYRFERNGSPVARGLDIELCLLLVKGQLRIHVGLNAPGKIFVHAGVVEHGGRALVLPGLSFCGKTTLVAALVRAGARYYSDEFAVLEESGLVHPFAQPLAIRDGGSSQNDYDVESLGGTVGSGPVPIGAVVLTEYRAGACWKPRLLSRGHGVLAMLEHTLAARARQQQALRVLSRATEGALLLEGQRGDAEEIAGALLEAASAHHRPTITSSVS